MKLYNVYDYAIKKVGDIMIMISSSETETFNLGVRLGEKLKAGTVLSLNGDLGAGKTQLTKGIAKGMGIEDYVTSPSFTILNEYEGRVRLYHFDVYRIEDVNEMYEIGFEEYLFGDGVCIVEWGDMVEEILPENTIHIKIKRLDEDKRELTIDDKGLVL